MRWNSWVKIFRLEIYRITASLCTDMSGVPKVVLPFVELVVGGTNVEENDRRISLDKPVAVDNLV